MNKSRPFGDGGMCYEDTVNGLEGQGQYQSLPIQNMNINVPNFYA